ncbi:MAG: methionyl-tRNA formyltransferase [Coriobacteriia bacterium]|nr:methionyl-tRNA formyltransferase [Coriobacteriia bacterium]
MNDLGVYGVGLLNTLGQQLEHSERIERPAFVMQKTRIVFMGTPSFAAQILDLMLDSCETYHEVVAVYSRPDAASKRGKATVPSAVSQLAIEKELPLFRPHSLRDEEVQEQLRSLRPDIIIVAAYGMILPPEVLDIPTHGCINVHASLLPRWRGAAPIERAILAGDAQTGVSIMRMEEGLDTGPYCAIESIEVGEKSSTQLRKELADLGARLLVSAMPALLEGNVQWVTQDKGKVTYADKIEKSDLKLSADLSAVDFVRRVRASSESAPARLEVEEKGTAVLAARTFDLGTFEEAPQSAIAIPAGKVKLVKHQGTRYILLGCVDGAVELLEVKPDNKKVMLAADWFNGFPKSSEGLSWD